MQMFVGIQGAAVITKTIEDVHGNAASFEMCSLNEGVLTVCVFESKLPEGVPWFDVITDGRRYVGQATAPPSPTEDGRVKYRVVLRLDRQYAETAPP